MAVPPQCSALNDEVDRLIAVTSDWPIEKLYRLPGAIKRENGRLKNDWALLPLRVRRIERVALRADLTILARLATALARAERCYWPLAPVPHLPAPNQAVRSVARGRQRLVLRGLGRIGPTGPAGSG
jgi:hypothetical protein